MTVKATGVAPPITLITPSLDPGLTVAPDLALGVLVSGQAWAPTNGLQVLEGLLFVGTSLDYEN